MTIEGVNENVIESVQQHGFAIIRHVLPCSLLDQVTSAIATHIAHSSVRNAGTRHLHQHVQEVADLIADPNIQQNVQTLLPGAFPVRSLFFDKTPEANWKVAWHQDLTICVEQRVDTEGFSAWSRKDGVVHVQPPITVLEQMITLRIHLDDCSEENGPLQVIPGSHTRGRLSAEEIATMRTEAGAVACTGYRGDVVSMKPLLLHASSPAREPKHRRVVHVEFASSSLPGLLRWIA